MKTALTIFLSLIVFTAFSQDTTYYDAEGMKVSSLSSCLHYRIIERNDLDTNIVVENVFFKDGKKQAQHRYNPYSRYIRDGKRYEWYNNGQIHFNIDYKDGKYHGNLLTYWEDGKPKRDETYQNGEKIEGKCWDSNGEEIPHFEFEKMPEFPGGENELVRYLSDNITYPKKARRNGQMGTVYLAFVVDLNGSVTNVRVIKGVTELLNEEASRVVKIMPKWNPGNQDGEAIRVTYNLPIRFSLK